MNQSFWIELDERLSDEDYNGYAIRSVILESFPAIIVFKSPALCNMCRHSDDFWKVAVSNIRPSSNGSWSKILIDLQKMNSTHNVGYILCKWIQLQDHAISALSDKELKVFDV